MSRVIRMLKRADVVELSGQKKKVVAALAKLGADSKPIEFTQLRKAVRSVDPKSLRARVRQLRDEKIVTVKRVA